MIRGGNDLQRFRRERRVHATRPGGRGHARLEFSEKLVHCGARYRVPTRVTKMRGASAHRDRRPRPSGRLPATLTEAQLDGRACIRCGAEALPRRPVEAWSRLSSQLFECVDTEGYRHRCGGRTEGVAE